MNTIKIFIAVIVFVLILNNLYSQKFYFTVNSGYNLKMGTKNVDFISNITNSTYYTTNIIVHYYHTKKENIIITKPVYLSFGRGSDLGVNFGYMPSNKIGFDLGISYLHGTSYKGIYKIESENTYYSLSDQVDSSFYSYSSAITKAYSKMLRIIPSIILSPGFEKINPYAKFGGIIGKGNIIINTDETDSDENKTITKEKRYGGFALGLTAAIGANYCLNEKISLFAEVNMINLNYAPTKGKILISTENGENLKENMTTREIETEYVDSVSDIESGLYNNTEPKQELKQFLPFGSYSLNVGIKISL